MWFLLGGSQQGAATWESAELLARLRDRVDRPDNDADLTERIGYQYLTDGQLDLAYELAAHIPWVMYGPPEQMTTTDDGLTYLTASEAMGRIEVYGALGQPPLVPGAYWDWNADYAQEGTRSIRMVGNRARQFSDGPYARYIVKPGVIDSATQPTIQPVDARRVLVEFAAAKFMSRGNRGDPAPFLNEANRMLWGDPASPAGMGLIPAIKLQYPSGGVSASAGGLWYRSPDFR